MYFSVIFNVANFGVSGGGVGLNHVGITSQAIIDTIVLTFSLPLVSPLLLYTWRHDPTTVTRKRWWEVGDLLWVGVWFGVSSKLPLVWGPISSNDTLPVELPVLGAESIALLSSFSRAESWWVSTEGGLTFTPWYGMVFTVEISGKSDSESNQLVRETSSIGQ